MSIDKKILLIGGGGHCKACIDVIEKENKFNIIGILDLTKKIGLKVLNYPIIDSEKNLDKLLSKTKNILITVGQIKSPELRKNLFKKAKNAGAHFPVIISPKAYVSKYSKIGEGTIIMHGAIVNADSLIGNNCIINNLSLIEHDVTIGNNTHISTGAKVNGNCQIGNNCFIGSGVVINQGTQIADNVTVGANSLVRKNLTEPGIYAGCILKKIK